MKQFIKLTSRATGHAVCINASKIEWFERDATNTETSGTAVWTSADACTVVKESPEHVEAAIKAATSGRGPSPLIPAIEIFANAWKRKQEVSKSTKKISNRLLCLRYAALRIAEAIIAGKTVIANPDTGRVFVILAVCVGSSPSRLKPVLESTPPSLLAFRDYIGFDLVDITDSVVIDSIGEILYEPRMLGEAEREPWPVPTFTD